MQVLASDDERVAFWRRHLRQGVGLCVALPVIIALRTVLLGQTGPAAGGPTHRTALLILAAAVASSSPLLLLVPVDRLTRHPYGRLFFDVWEASGIALIVAFARLDGGPDSPYVLCLFVLLAHAALAYPPAGLALAGLANTAGYLVLVAAAGGEPLGDVLAVTLTLAVMTATCAFASHNHLTAYRRTAAYARQIAQLAARDGLTGCLNHRTFHERLQAEALIADRDHPLSLLIIDVDEFKTVNDTHGHPAGDTVLQHLGAQLISLCRADDAAGRLGGDEFALLLPHTPAAHAAQVAERLRQGLDSSASPYPHTISVGVATTSRRADAAALLVEADHAVYAAKRGGRNRVATTTHIAGAARLRGAIIHEPDADGNPKGVQVPIEATCPRQPTRVRPRSEAERTAQPLSRAHPARPKVCRRH